MIGTGEFWHTILSLSLLVCGCVRDGGNKVGRDASCIHTESSLLYDPNIRGLRV